MPDINSLADQYKLNSLGLLPDYCLQEIFSREMDNHSISKIVILVSEDTRNIILENCNIIRAKHISRIIDKYHKKEIEIPFSRFEKSCEELMERVQLLKDSGRILIPEIVLNESFFDKTNELNEFSDTLPRFNFIHNDQHELISWWNLAAKNISSLFGKRIQAENIVIERLDDDFSSRIFAHAIDDLSRTQFAGKAEELFKAALADYSLRLKLMETFFLSLIESRKDSFLAKELAAHFSDDKNIYERTLKNGPLLLVPAVKDSMPPQDVAMSLYKLKLIFDEFGAEELDKYTRSSNNSFFKKCLSITLNSSASDYGLRIITQRKKAALNDFEIKLKMIVDAATCIRENVSTYLMLELMSSYTVYDFEE